MNAHNLFWTESNIEKIEISDSNLIVVANNVTFAGNKENVVVKVTFVDVVESKREITEYIGDPRGNPTFKEPYVVEDLPKKDVQNNFEVYGLEGITSFEPIAWIDWEIKAKESYVEFI